MSMTQFQGQGKKLLLWIPSERGFGQNYIPIALNLSMLDYDVWALHLHDSYIIPAGRDSLNEVETGDLLEIINNAKQQGFEAIFLMSAGRGGLLSLKTAYQFQKLFGHSDELKGLLFFSPYLVKGRTEIGQDADYEKIASFSNLPVFLLQPQYGTKFARSREIAEQLHRGGSPVFIKALRGVRAGFYMRPEEDLSQQDISMREQLPEILDNAVKLLSTVHAADFNDGYTENLSIENNQLNIHEPVLQPYKGDKSPPVLRLSNLQDLQVDIEQFNDQVVLVNFWATWCGPCVEEIPSLSRLVEKMKGKPFKVVAVNIGESTEVIQKFVKSIPVNFEILLDKENTAVRDWKVYAYPSNYLLDRDGKIQYAYRGALHWDSENIVNTINSLLE